MLKPVRCAGIAVGVDLLHPVAHLVINEGNGIPERIDAAGQELVVIPLVAPVFTALVNVADDQILRVPVVAARLTVVVLNGRQSGGQIVAKAATVAGAGAVFYHAPVIEFFPAIFTFQPARQTMPDHQAVVVIAVFAGDNARGIRRARQLAARIVAPLHQRPATVAVEMAGGGHALRESFVLIAQGDVYRPRLVVKTDQPAVLVPLCQQRVAVLVTEGGQTQDRWIRPGRFIQTPHRAVIVSNRHVAALITADNDAFADAVKRAVNRRQLETQLAPGFVVPGGVVFFQRQIAVKGGSPAQAKQPFAGGQAVVAALPAKREAARQREIEFIIVIQHLHAGGGVNRVRGTKHGIDGHIGQHPAAGRRQRAGHVFQNLARTAAEQGERNHPQRQTRRFAAFDIANRERVAADDHVRGDVVGNGPFAGGAIFRTHRRLAVNEDAFRAFRQILRSGVLFTRYLVFFQRRGARGGRGHARLPHFATKLSGSGKQHARVIGKAAWRLRLR